MWGKYGASFKFYNYTCIERKHKVMPLKIKFFVRTNKNKKDNDANIRVRVKNGTKFDLFSQSGFQVNPKYWNDEKGTYRQRIEFRDYDENVRKLSLLSKTIESEYYNL